MGGEIQQPTSTSPESSTKPAREREAPAEAWVRIGRQLRVPLAAFAVGSALWVALILTITPLLWLRASAVPGRTPLRVSVALLALAFAIPAAASRDPWAGARFTRLALRAPYAFLRGLLWTIQAGWAVFVFLVHPGRIARAGIALFALSPIAAVLSVAPHVDPPLLIASICILLASVAVVLRLCFAIANQPLAPWIVVVLTVIRFSRVVRRNSRGTENKRIFGKETSSGIQNGLRLLARLKPDFGLDNQPTITVVTEQQPTTKQCGPDSSSTVMFAQVGVSAVLDGSGFEASLGVAAANTAGIFGFTSTGSQMFGTNLGPSFQVGAVRGYSNFVGNAHAVDIAVGPVAITIYRDASDQHVIGGAFGYSPSVPGIKGGASSAKTYTNVYDVKSVCY